MNKIMEELNTKFAGQSAARLDTYAGKMDLLRVASANASETIGKSLLDALAALGDDNSIEGLSKNMEDFATATAEVITGLGIVAERLKKLTTIPGVGNIFDVKNIPVLGGYIGGLQQLGRNAMPQQDRGGQERTAGRINAQQKRLETQVIKNAVTLRKAENEQLKKKTAVDELRDKFDLERIGINAALNAATDEETKLRLKSQLAILDNNEALAKKFLAEMNAAEAAKKLAEAMAASAAALEAAFRATIARLAIYDPVRNIAPGQGGGYISNVPSTPFIGTPFGQAGGNTGPITATPVNVTLELAPNAGEFGQLIYNSFLMNQKNGLQQTVNGGL
jgi:hypothetical protein